MFTLFPTISSFRVSVPVIPSGDLCSRAWVACGAVKAVASLLPFCAPISSDPGSEGPQFGLHGGSGGPGPRNACHGQTKPLAGSTELLACCCLCKKLFLG